MNQNIRKILDAIEILRGVQGCELEVQSLSHKAKAMYSQGKEGLEGVAFIDACNDEELTAAIKQREEKTGLFPHPDPRIINYLRKNRSWALHLKS